jgi:RHS repeat-associated protein
MRQTGTLKNPYTYTGREYDDELRLYYYRARHYDPRLGRFLQEEPIKFAGGLHLYQYALNDPINYTDPQGLDAIRIIYVGYPVDTGVGNIHLPLGAVNK